MDTDFIDLNVVILPDLEKVQNIISLSKNIYSKYSTYYVLNQKDHLPHLSLYSARYPLKNKQKVLDIIRDISHNQRSFPITLHGYSVFSGFIFYDVLPNKALQSLHKMVVDSLNPLREGLVSDNMMQLKNLTELQRKAIDRYGYVSVKELYMPHISLSALSDVKLAKIVSQELPSVTTQLEANTIAVASFAMYGTCPKPFVTYKLVL